MSFVRAKLTDGGRLESIARAGVGFLANVTPTAFAAETDETLTVAEIGGGLLIQGTTLTSDVTYTLPTAALIVAEWPEMDVGDAYTFYVGNAQAGAFDVILAVGAGITLIGANNSAATPPQASRMYTLVKSGAATYDLY